MANDPVESERFTMEEDSSFCLGIDIGTTSIKASLIGQNRRLVAETVSAPSNAFMPSVSAPRDGSEQNIWLIFKAIEDCLTKLGPDQLKLVSRIGVTGQMHGCVMWKSESVSIEGSRLCIKTNEISPLFDWQDGRCTSRFLTTLPKPESHLGVSTGYGCATLFWWSHNHPEYLEQFDHAGTVMDLLVALLCSREEPVMSLQNAASWGYFNCQTSTWNREILSDAGFPTRFLPEVCNPGCLAGTVQTSWLGLKPGAKVIVAMGDLPCSVYSVIESPSDAVINIGTSAQLVHMMPEDFRPEASPATSISSVAHFAYFNDRYLAVAASLNGGNVLAALVDSFLHWCSLLGSRDHRDKEGVYTKLIDLARKAETNLLVDPVLRGERHRQDDRGSIANIGPDSLCDPGGVFRAFCRGIIVNIESLMSKDELKQVGVKRIVGCGSALSQNPILKEELERCFELPVLYRDDSDSCLGAALFVQSLPCL